MLVVDVQEDVIHHVVDSVQAVVQVVVDPGVQEVVLLLVI